MRIMIHSMLSALSARFSVRKDLQAREDRAFRLRLLAAEPEVRRRLGRIPLLQRACTPLYAVSGDSNTVSFRALLGS